MTFSEGPRNCIGQHLAKFEMAVALATLLGHYSFAPAPRMGSAKDIEAQMKMRFTVRRPALS